MFVPGGLQHDKRRRSGCIQAGASVYAQVLRRIVEGSDSLVWSWVLSFENDKHPKPDRRDEIAVWETRSERLIAVNTDLEERTRQIARQGIPALDAAHLASAEAGGAEIMLTCDDVVLRRAPRLGLAYGF